MFRAAIAVVVGLVVWIICATALDILLRFTLRGYAAASPTGRDGDPVYEPYIRKVDVWTLRCNSFALLCEIVFRRA